MTTPEPREDAWREPTAREAMRTARVALVAALAANVGAVAALVVAFF